MAKQKKRTLKPLSWKIILLITPISILILVVIYWLFRIYGVDVTSIDFAVWFTIAATVFAGNLTIIGVKYTITNQHAADAEVRKLEYRPLLRIETEQMSWPEYCEKYEGLSFYVDQESMGSCGFPTDMKNYTVFHITLVGRPAYHVRISEIMLYDGFPVRERSANNPKDICLLYQEESVSVLIDYVCYKEAITHKGVSSNVFGFIRLEYSDILQNEYVQDIFITIQYNFQGDTQEITLESIKEPRDKDVSKSYQEYVRRYDEYRLYELDKLE